MGSNKNIILVTIDQGPGPSFNIASNWLVVGVDQWASNKDKILVGVDQGPGQVPMVSNGLVVGVLDRGVWGSMVNEQLKLST